MIKKIETLKSIIDVGVVAVVRASSSKEAINIARASIKGGINAIEVTFTVPGAEDVISSLKKEFKGDEIIIVAGTVLDSETARIAILKGAEYIVSPGFDSETAKLCNRYQIPYMAGCMTITEIIKAMESGVDVIKLFPGSAFGPGMVKDIKSPLPQAPIMPTGGVSLENVEEWIKNGCIAVGIGGCLTAPAKTGDYDKVTSIAKEFVSKVKKARE